MVRWLVVGAAGVLVWLQYNLWFGTSGYVVKQNMEHQIEQQMQRVAVLKQRNQVLAGEVIALKRDSSVLEARARHDLGMVKRGEVFYLIPDKDT